MTAAAPRPPAAAAPGVIAIPPDSPQLEQIRVQAVGLGDVPTDETVAPVRVVANPNRVARVVPPVQGRVLRVVARLGDFVEQGQPLLTMRSPDGDAAIAAYLQAEAAERQAKVALAKAEADAKRTTDLYEHKAIAEKDVLAAQNDLAQAKAAVETTAAIRQQARLKLELLGLRPDDFRQPIEVRAPISGRVLEVNVAPGEYRSAVSFNTDIATPLLTIADLSTIWIAADVPEPSIRLIHVGQPAVVSLIAYPGEFFTGRVTRIADVVDPQTRTVKVYLELPNPGGRLRPDMYGTMRHAGSRARLPVLPAAAVVREYGRSTVFIERGPGRFERRNVTLGRPVGDVVPVVDGLRGGDRVVVDGAMLLKDR